MSVNFYIPTVLTMIAKEQNNVFKHLQTFKAIFTFLTNENEAVLAKFLCKSYKHILYSIKLIS